MEEDRLLILLDTLSSSDTPIGSERCAKRLKMHTAAFKKSVPVFNEMLKGHGAEIISKSGRGNGYQLRITDLVKFNHYKNDELPSRVYSGALDYGDQDSRVYHIAAKLLTGNEWLKSQDLAEQMNISQSQFSKDMKLVRNLLAKYQIKVVDRPHYGLKAEGDEFQVRTCFAYVVAKTKKISNLARLMNVKNGPDELGVIQQLVIKKANEFGYMLNALILDNLVAHLYVAYHRVLNHQDIILPEEMRAELREDGTFPLAASIVKSMQDTFHTSFPDDEVYYVIIHLSSKQIVTPDSPFVTADVMSLVDEMLRRIHSQFNIDFSKDLNLRMMMAMHTVPLLKRIEYHTTLSNPLMPEIRHRLLVAYDLALCCASVINEKYNCDLSEDEISYFALHIEVALNQKNQMQKKDILLVCATGRGSAQLMRSSFMENYSSEIGSLTCCDVIEVQLIDVSGFDAIFTTVPFSLANRTGKIPPIFQVDSLMENGSSEQVKKLLSSASDVRKVSSYFRPEMFITDIEAEDRSELIRQICRRINQAYPLPKGFEKAVLEREEMAQTDFGGNAAFPHPCRIMTSDTFISVCVLKKPMQWGRGKVQIVLLSSFEKGFIRNNGEIFRVLSALISDRHYSEMLIAEPKYETLQKIIEMIC